MDQADVPLTPVGATSPGKRRAAPSRGPAAPGRGSVATDELSAGIGRATGTARRPLLGVVALAAAFSLSACSAAPGVLTGRGAQVRTSTFDSGAVAKSRHGLPDWVPDDATGIRQSVRTTGDEQILTMRGGLEDLPRTCTQVGADHPLAPHPEDGRDPSDFRTMSTIQADWWPVEIEQHATMTCGRWWITAEDGSLYGFTPELRTVPVN